MKVIIAGSRTIFPSYDLMADAVLRSGFDITVVVSGMAKGVDSEGMTWAVANEIPLAKFYPDWKLHGRAAGPIRNKQMAEFADALIAIWDGKSSGTKNMIDTMRAMNKPVYIMRHHAML